MLNGCANIMAGLQLEHVDCQGIHPQNTPVGIHEDHAIRQGFQGALKLVECFFEQIFFVAPCFDAAVHPRYKLAPDAVCIRDRIIQRAGDPGQHPVQISTMNVQAVCQNKSNNKEEAFKKCHVIDATDDMVLGRPG